MALAVSKNSGDLDRLLSWLICSRSMAVGVGPVHGACIPEMGATLLIEQYADNIRLVAPPPPAPSGTQDDDEHTDIAVTRQLRKQAPIHVGPSVNILNRADPITRGIAATADLAGTIPTFVAANCSLSTPVYSVRGEAKNLAYSQRSDCPVS